MAKVVTQVVFWISGGIESVTSSVARGQGWGHAVSVVCFQRAGAPDVLPMGYTRADCVQLLNNEVIFR